jgi:citrate-Mg2+:H+ or citrate-Ca2+:H+ symporter, CitMHS family
LVASTYLLVGLCEIDFGAHQRFTLPWSLGAAGVMLLVGSVTGVIPLF